jgi:hypothetical protein
MSTPFQHYRLTNPEISDTCTFEDNCVIQGEWLSDDSNEYHTTTNAYEKNEPKSSLLYTEGVSKGKSYVSGKTFGFQLNNKWMQDYDKLLDTSTDDSIRSPDLPLHLCAFELVSEKVKLVSEEGGDEFRLLTTTQSIKINCKNTPNYGITKLSDIILFNLYHFVFDHRILLKQYATHKVKLIMSKENPVPKRKTQEKR